MTSQPRPPGFALRTTHDSTRADGAWWPRNRNLGEQLEELFTSWPEEAGTIVRVLYSPPDWDDHPRSVAVGARRIKTGSFPRDDNHELQLSLLGGQRRFITVIPPDTEADAAAAALGAISA